MGQVVVHESPFPFSKLLTERSAEPGIHLHKSPKCVVNL